MTSFLRRLIGFVLLVIVFAGACRAVNQVLLGAHVPSWAGEVEVLFVGDSHIMVGLDDGLIPQARNVGMAGEPLTVSVAKVRYLLPHLERLRTVVIGVGPQNLSAFNDLKFVRQFTGQQLKQFREDANTLRKDHKQGRVDTGTALRSVFDLYGDAFGPMTFWRNVALRNPGNFASSQLQSASVVDEQIPDDIASDGGGFATRYGGRLDRVYTRRCMTGARLLQQSIDKMVDCAQKNGESVEVNTRLPPGVTPQGPVVSSFSDPVFQLEVRPFITVSGAVRLQISPELSDDFAIVHTQAAAGQPTIDVSTVNVLDGETVVLGGLVVDGSQTVESELPFLSDIPLLGRLFRAANPGATKRNLIILTTPTILDDM